MTIEKPREVARAEPFKPLRIHVADGRNIAVKHTDFLPMSPVGRTIHVFHEDGHSEFIDLLLVTCIEISSGHAGRSRRRG